MLLNVYLFKQIIKQNNFPTHIDAMKLPFAVCTFSLSIFLNVVLLGRPCSQRIVNTSHVLDLTIYAIDSLQREEAVVNLNTLKLTKQPIKRIAVNVKNSIFIKITFMQNKTRIQYSVYHTKALEDIFRFIKCSKILCFLKQRQTKLISISCDIFFFQNKDDKAKLIGIQSNTRPHKFISTYHFYKVIYIFLYNMLL